MILLFCASQLSGHAARIRTSTHATGDMTLVFPTPERGACSCAVHLVPRCIFAWASPHHTFSLSFNLFPVQSMVCRARHVGFAGKKVAGSWAFAAAFGPAGAGAGGFRDTGGCPQLAADVAKPPPDPARRQRPGGIGLFLPGPPEAACQGPGKQELGVRGHEEPDPAAGLAGGPYLRRGEPEGALEELEGMLLMQISSLRAQCGRADNAAWRVNAVAAVVAGRGLSA